MRGSCVLFLAFAAVFIAVAVSSDSYDAADQPSEAPEDLYPDADVILTLDSRGNILMTFKAYGDYKVTEQHPSIWFTQVFMSNSDVTLRDFDDVGKRFKVVMDGPTIRALSLFSVKETDHLGSAIDLEFILVSGTIQSFSFFSIDSKVEDQIGRSYDLAYTLISNANIDFRTGKIGEFNPTSHILAITNLNLQCGLGMNIDRLYPTGENGKYSDVKVAINGSTVGYISNLSSKIGSLEYHINSGSIDYFCIGANTEHERSRNLRSMPTAYTTGDVNVVISDVAKVGNCIIGAGILNMPRILSNGVHLNEQIVHMVSIDAPSTTIYNDISFLNERRNLAYHFGSYTVGQSPGYSAMMDTIIINGNTTRIYDENGIWASVSSCIIPIGGMLYVNADYLIPEDSIFKLSKGATMYNSGNIILYGDLEIEGKMVNNSIIQCRTGYTVSGEFVGIGYLADFIHYTTSTSSMNVISNKLAVVINQDETYPVDEITALLSTDFRSVCIKSDHSHSITGNQFTIALTEADYPEIFKGAYKLDIRGISGADLAVCSVYVTIPTDSEQCTAVYVYNEDSDKYELLATSEHQPHFEFKAGSNNMFYIFNYSSGSPELPVDPSVPENRMNVIDYLLIAAIIGVLAVTLYSLVTMKRD